MLNRLRFRSSGFTLVEMAIVLGIVGILTTGLWRLMDTSSHQSKDQATAQQQTALIQAVQAFLADTGTSTLTCTGPVPSIHGQTLLSQMDPNTVATIPLTVSTTNITSSSAAKTVCLDLVSFLPSGFTSTTTNPYGQSYAIQVMKDGQPAGNAPQSYSFMIVTTGGSTISDPDGGRISGLIGNDGGFIYTAPVCTAASSTKAACGALGGWTIPDVTAAPTAGYSFGAAVPAYGHLASRTFVSTLTSNMSNWLARAPIPMDASHFQNTMTTDLYLGGKNLLMQTYGGSGTGTINLQGGTIDASAAGSIINLGAGGTITGTAAGGGNPIFIDLHGASASNTNPLFSIMDSSCGGSCSPTAPNVMSITGNVGMAGGTLTALDLYATNITYNTSDRRLKKDIHPLEGSLDKVLQLDPVSFTYRNSGQKSMGVIAQDLQKIYPELIGTDSKNHLAVNYIGLIAPLIESVQELKKENDDLRTALTAQEARQAHIEEELKALQK